MTTQRPPKPLDRQSACCRCGGDGVTGTVTAHAVWLGTAQTQLLRARFTPQE